ncbi:MAG TPA: hypothetical protein PLR65_11490, partial [Anaerolineales bacterium]|nr:hypothetical protein [Anaerolineales bacterium]
RYVPRCFVFAIAPLSTRGATQPPSLVTTTLPSFSISTSSQVFNNAKSDSEIATNGIGFAYISSATTDARAKKKSVAVVMMPAGAVPARIDSSNTAVVVDDPRVNGMARILPFAISPESGCRRSMISPVFQS